MRKMKLPVLPSTCFTVARRMATLSAAIVMLLVVTATAQPTDTRTMAVDTAFSEPGTDGTLSSSPGFDADQTCLTDGLIDLIDGGPGYIACFKDYGDKFFVYDGDADGASAAAYWWTLDGRYGICYNSHGADTWAECNYNMSETSTVIWHTCSHDRSASNYLYCTVPYAYRSTTSRAE